MKNVLRLCAVMAIGFLGVACPVQAQEPARLFLQAAPLPDENLLVVDVSVENVADLYGAEFQLAYDPAYLEVQDANPRLDGIQIALGSFMPADERFVVSNEVDPEAGTIHFAATLLNPAPPVSGDGVLASIAFQVVGSGASSVRVTQAQLASSDFAALPLTTTDLEIKDTGPGQFSQPWPTTATGPEPPVARPAVVPEWAWWVLGVAGGLLLSILVFVLVVNRPRRKSVSGRSEPAGRRMPSASLPPSQSAVNLAEQGKRAMQRGDMQMAYELFSRAVEQDPANSAAWLGKGLVAQQETEKRICFQRVVALDPDNSVARTELNQLAESI